MLELEKVAFNEGFKFAVAFVNGSCRLCEKCNVEKGICIHSKWQEFRNTLSGSI
ncbi:DUF2284 domain-containing protein [Methanosarcina barkeri]